MNGARLVGVAITLPIGSSALASGHFVVIQPPPNGFLNKFYPLVFLLLAIHLHTHYIGGSLSNADLQHWICESVVRSWSFDVICFQLMEEIVVLRTTTTMLAALFASVLSAPIFAASETHPNAYELNLRQGVTDISAQVYDLHMTILIICCVIGVIVFGVMLYSIIFHRKSRGFKPSTFHESVKVEIAWTVVPFLILMFMAVPATKTLIAMEDTSASDVSILVTGSQWKWHYKYMENDVEYYSVLATQREQIQDKFEKGKNYLLEVDRPLVIPTDQKVRFLLTSDDVIHSWWVPDFAVKKDANPGFINEAWTRVNEPGIYRGQCAELCGKDHGFMPVVVIAKEPAEYRAWIAEQEAVQLAAKREEQRLLAMNMDMEELRQLMNIN